MIELLGLLGSLPVIIKTLVVAGAIGVGALSHYVLKLPKNNALEQTAEQVIKNETGIDVDFSSLQSVDDLFDSPDDESVKPK